MEKCRQAVTSSFPVYETLKQFPVLQCSCFKPHSYWPIGFHPYHLVLAGTFLPFLYVLCPLSYCTCVGVHLLIYMLCIGFNFSLWKSWLRSDMTTAVALIFLIDSSIADLVGWKIGLGYVLGSQFKSRWEAPQCV